jgi:hypothetical protein
MRSNLWPSVTENFRFLFRPLSKNIFAEVRSFIQTSVCKVEKKWRTNNRHLYRAEFLIDLQQLRHIEAENTRSLLFTQTVIDAALKLERALLTVKLYREKSWFCVVFGSEDSTMDAKAQPLA